MSHRSSWRVRPAGAPVDAEEDLTRRYIQPYGCISANRSRQRPHLRRTGGRHPAGHRAPRDRREGGRRRAGRALPDELRGGAEARRRPRAGRPRQQASHRTAKGRPHKPRGAPRGAAPPRRLRGAVARARRAHEPAHKRTAKGGRPMTVTAVRKDPQSRTMTLEAEFDASPERVWQLWADPRQLERWWGPPTYPATFDAHDLRPGGHVEYHMTGPEGDQPRGFWEVDEVEPPHRLVFRDGFADEDGTPNTGLPLTTARVTIQESGGGKTRMSIESEFPTVEAMEQLAAMGMEEGLREAVGQIDAILAEDPLEARRGRR